MASPDSLRQAIQFLHMAIAEHDDPAAKQTLATCLQNMLKVQANDHAQAQQGQGAVQSVIAQLGAR